MLEKTQLLRKSSHLSFQKEAVWLEALSYPNFDFHKKHVQTVDHTHPQLLLSFLEEKEKQKLLNEGIVP